MRSPGCFSCRKLAEKQHLEGIALVAQGAIPLLRGTIAQVEFVPLSRGQLIAKTPPDGALFSSDSWWPA